MNISLPDALKDFVEAEVATGLYANASDYVRHVLRQRMLNSSSLDQAIEEGEASGWSDKTVEQVFAEAKRQFLSV